MARVQSSNATGMTTNGTTEIAYIAAAPRSGTTILASLLGNVSGYFNAGEVRFIWRQIAKAGRCGCGTQLTRCEVWSSILRAAPDHSDERVVANLTAAGLIHSRIGTLPRCLMQRRLLGRLPRHLHDYMARILPVYPAIAASQNSAMIVDSSKSPSYAYLLATSPNIKVHLLHVVRDPRAVVYSTLRDPGNAAPNWRRKRAILYSASKWLAWNLWIEMFLRRRAATYVQVAYEDFADAPYEQLDRVVASHGRDVAHPRLADDEDHVARLVTNHTVYGNGNRFRVGPTPIRSDDEWKTAMRPHERALVTALTWPLLARYGFHSRRTEPASSS
jgi:hypothetical protein